MNLAASKLGPGDRDLGDGKAEHIHSEAEMNAGVAQGLNKATDRLLDNTIALAVRAKEAREFLDWHANHVKATWLDWTEQSKKVLEDIRLTRVAIEFESKQLLSACADVRKFFLADDHEKEITKLREFVELAERLRALKNDGTLDRLADTILKLA